MSGNAGAQRARAWLSWSSGKDSAFALHELRREETVEVVGLLVTLNAEFDRVAMHGVRRRLVEAQAERAGLPLHLVEIPHRCPNHLYEQRMEAVLATAIDQGVSRIAFGDLYLEDIRAYRESWLSRLALEACFPLWGRPTRALARAQIAAGVRAILICVDPQRLAPEFAGRDFDEALLRDLPLEVDPCGENGEFHTFVWDSPDFHAPVGVEPGQVVLRDGFVFADLIPEGVVAATDT